MVHPQHWPEDLDYTGKKVVVIGSGATAVSMVPALARKAAKVTMLQRSPGYLFSMQRNGLLTRTVRAVLPKSLSYWAIRFIALMFERSSGWPPAPHPVR